VIEGEREREREREKREFRDLSEIGRVMPRVNN
jgi:hypothetical protein